LEHQHHCIAALLAQPESLSFRQQPTLEDCFPASRKLYKDVQHENGPLQVCDCGDILDMAGTLVLTSGLKDALM